MEHYWPAILTKAASFAWLEQVPKCGSVSVSLGDALLSYNPDTTGEEVATFSVSREQLATADMKSNKLNPQETFCIFILSLDDRLSRKPEQKLEN